MVLLQQLQRFGWLLVLMLQHLPVLARATLAGMTALPVNDARNDAVKAAQHESSANQLQEEADAAASQHAATQERGAAEHATPQSHADSRSLATWLCGFACSAAAALWAAAVYADAAASANA